MMIRRLAMVNEICRKAQIKRQDASKIGFSKRELVILNSFIDVLLSYARELREEQSKEAQRGR